MGHSAYVERIRSFTFALFMGMGLLESREPKLGGMSHLSSWLWSSSIEKGVRGVREVVSHVDEIGKNFYYETERVSGSVRLASINMAATQPEFSLRHCYLGRMDVKQVRVGGCVVKCSRSGSPV